MSEERKMSSRWPVSKLWQHRENSQLPVLAQTLRNRAERRKALAMRMGTPMEPESPPPEKPPEERSVGGQGWQRWLVKWQFWLALMVLLPGGAGLLAIASLFRLSAQPNCLSLFWLTASASERLYCAEEIANKQTADDLLKAIDMVNSLPKDHPLRTEINHQIENWSQDMLKLGEVAFQEGRLAEAIEIAQKVPNDVPAYALVEKQVKQWQSIWSQAEQIYQAAEEQLRKEEWNQAFREATRLLDLGNTYWETTKYEEISQAIQTSRSDGGKLAKARSVAAEGGLENLLAAIKLVGAIAPKSYLYQAAQKAIEEFSQKIMAIADSRLQAGKWQEALDIASKIPDSANFQEQIKDFSELAHATSLAGDASVKGLEAAVKVAQKLDSNRPLYNKAQDFVKRWQQEIADVKLLERARQLAAPAGVNDLKAAIAQLQGIDPSNPRGQEAQKQMNEWTRQVELMEDSPYLKQAEQLATAGDVKSLEVAISQAERIGRGRTLYQQAQAKIQEWVNRSQQLQDQPLLDQARQLASEGNLAAAVDAAGRIAPGRSLYEQARSQLRKWQEQLQAQQSLENAGQVALSGTPDALETAIALAGRIPSGSSLRWQAETAINDWSQRILAIGLDQAQSDVPGAIATLSKIPPQAKAYEEARSQIRAWQRSLAPAPASSQPSEEPVEKENQRPKFSAGGPPL